MRFSVFMSPWIGLSLGCGLVGVLLGAILLGEPDVFGKVLGFIVGVLAVLWIYFHTAMLVVVVGPVRVFGVGVGLIQRDAVEAIVVSSWHGGTVPQYQASLRVGGSRISTKAFSGYSRRFVCWRAGRLAHRLGVPLLDRCG